MWRIRSRKSTVRVCGLVVGSLGCALAGRWLLDRYVGSGSAYVFFLVATAVVAWVAGFIPALITLALGFLLTDWFFVQPRESLQFVLADDWVNALGYWVVGLAMTWFSKLQQAARAQAVRQAEAAESKRRELAREIAEHHQTRAAHEMLAAIVESAEDAIVSKTLEGIITSWNAGAERLFGYRAQEAVGRSIMMLIPPELEIEEEAILERLRRGVATRQYETVRLRKDGSWVEVSLRISPVRNGKGELIGASKVARDISARKAAERALQAAQAELTRRTEALEQEVAARTAELTTVVHQLEAFAYTVSHDLRSSLRAIKGMSNALREDYGHFYDQEGKEYAERIVQSVERMEHLIAALLSYSKIGRGEVPVVEVELGDYLAKLRKHWTTELQAHRAHLEIAPHMPSVIANPVLLDQVLTNLVSNALKFVAPGTTPRVQVKAEVVDGVVRLKVVDNGIGIAPKQCAKLFQVFQRVHSAEKYPGLGIGLVIVRKAAERMGGCVGVQSEPGKGSCFWVELPRAS